MFGPTRPNVWSKPHVLDLEAPQFRRALLGLGESVGVLSYGQHRCCWPSRRAASPRTLDSAPVVPAEPPRSPGRSNLFFQCIPGRERVFHTIGNTLGALPGTGVKTKFKGTIANTEQALPSAASCLFTGSKALGLLNTCQVSSVQGVPFCLSVRPRGAVRAADRWRLHMQRSGRPGTRPVIAGSPRISALYRASGPGVARRRWPMLRAVLHPARSARRAAATTPDAVGRACQGHCPTSTHRLPSSSLGLWRSPAAILVPMLASHTWLGGKRTTAAPSSSPAIPRLPHH
jgi:hypothetical protein